MTDSGDRARARSRLHPEALRHAGDLSAELRIHAVQRPALLLLVRMVLQGEKGRVKTAESFLADYQPRVDGRPESAPAYDDLTEPRTFPKVSACMATVNKCACYNQQGSLIEMDDYRCRFYVNRGWFDPYIQPVENRDEMREVRADGVVASAPAYSHRGPVVYAMTNSDSTPHLEGRK